MSIKLQENANELICQIIQTIITGLGLLVALGGLGISWKALSTANETSQKSLKIAEDSNRIQLLPIIKRSPKSIDDIYT